MKKGIFGLLLFLGLGGFSLYAQDNSQATDDLINFCNANFSEDHISKLKASFDALEDHLVQNRVLEDTSGKSYFSVFKRIAKEGDLKIAPHMQLGLLDSTDFNVLNRCLYKFLSIEELEALSLRHYELMKRIFESIALENDISPKIIAQKFVEYLAPSDFNLQFYRLLSLIAFYKVLNPPNMESLFLWSTHSRNKNIEESLLIELNNVDEFKIEGIKKPFDEVRLLVFQFLLVDTFKKEIEITASRGASYECFINLMDMINEQFDKISNMV